MRAASLPALALAVLFLLPSVSQAQEILTELPSEDLLALLEELRFADVHVHNEASDGTSIRVETDSFFFFVENYDSGYVRLVAWFDNDAGSRRSTLNLVNEWNSQHSFSKAYLDSNGQFVLEVDFSLDHDLTEFGVEERILQYVEHLNAFGAHINS